MNRTDLVHGIRKSWFFAKAIGIDQQFSNPVPLEASGKFKKLSSSPSSSYEEVYLEGLRGGQYNILLADYAFLQFGTGKTDGVRFAYYPNPFIGASPTAVSELAEMQEFVGEGIIDMDEFLHSVSELRHSQHPPMVRYEYSRTQYVELNHPCSHLHLGFHADNRWPVGRYLTPSAFSLLTFKLFYASFWQSADQVEVGGLSVGVDQALRAAKQECRLLADDEFSAAESAQFFFG